MVLAFNQGRQMSLRPDAKGPAGRRPIKKGERAAQAPGAARRPAGSGADGRRQRCCRALWHAGAPPHP